MVTRVSELAQAPLVVSSSVAYGIFDGLLQQALLRQVTDESGGVAGRLHDSAESVLESLIVAR